MQLRKVELKYTFKKYNNYYAYFTHNNGASKHPYINIP